MFLYKESHLLSVEEIMRGKVIPALYPRWKKLVKIGQIEGNLDSPRFIIS